MFKAYKFRLYPNKNQIEIINKIFGSSRYVYNYYLDKMKNNGYTPVSTNIKDYTSILQYNASFLQETDSNIIIKSLFRLDNAYKKLFTKTGGYPKFKSKDNKLSSKINDATFSEIIRELQYKSKYKGKVFYQIDTYYPSSQICSRCDNQDKRYKDLTKREYKCTKCNQELDRDLNASINIMFEGLKLYMKNYARI